MQGSVQPTQVAGSFYPAEADACLRLVDDALAGARTAPVVAKAVIAPHAGFVYSAPIQASAYAPLRARRGEITRVVILAPAHRLAFKGLALSPAESWDTPLGPDVRSTGRSCRAS
jgi:MEMO1 family protein